MRTDDLTARAFRAYFRTGGTDQPANYSGEAGVNGRRYVVLPNCNGILAVYRVQTSGVLKRLLRWPKELEVW